MTTMTVLVINAGGDDIVSAHVDETAALRHLVAYVRENWNDCPNARFRDMEPPEDDTEALEAYFEDYDEWSSLHEVAVPEELLRERS